MVSRDTISTELNVLADFNPIIKDDYKNSKIILLGNFTSLHSKSDYINK